MCAGEYSGVVLGSYIYIYRERERRACPPRELCASAYYACMREDDERIIKILDKRITCNRKDLQQLVAGSTAAVCAPWDAENKAFQYWYLRHKNRRTKESAVARLSVASETMQREENINLQQRENKFSLCNKLILSTIGNQRFPVCSLASSKLQIVENAEYNWLRILCTYLLLSKK